MIDILCYREFDPNLKTVPFSGKISKDEIEYLQQFFEEPLTEEMVRKAIDENNWGGDYTENFIEFGFKGDSDNRDSVTEMIRKTFNL